MDITWHSNCSFCVFIRIQPHPSMPYSCCLPSSCKKAKGQRTATSLQLPANSDFLLGNNFSETLESVALKNLNILCPKCHRFLNCVMGMRPGTLSLNSTLGRFSTVLPVLGVSVNLWLFWFMSCGSLLEFTINYNN